MGLELIDFVTETDDVELEDFPPEVQSRINTALDDLTGGEGGPNNDPGEDAPQSIVVSENGGDGDLEFSSVQAAEEFATLGDVIFVEAGEYNEQVTIDTDNLSIEAAGGADVTISKSGESGEPTIAVDADDVDISNLTIDRTGSGDLVAQAVRVAGSNVTLANNTYSATGTNDAAISCLTNSSGVAGNPDVSGETFDSIEISDGEIRDSAAGLLVADSGEADFAENAVNVSDVSFTGNDDHVVGLDTGGSVVDTESVLANNTFDAAASPDSIEQTIDGFSVDTLITSEIRSAEDAAASDATVTVLSGDYTESVEVDTAGLTLEGPNAAVPGDEDGNRGTEATIEGFVDVSADNVRVRGFSVSPPDDFTEKPAAGVLINGSYSEVENNVVGGIRGDGSVSIHGVQIFKQSPERLEDITVSNNLIRDIDNDGGEEWPDYGGSIGIKVQNQLNGVTVTNNTVEEVYSKGWTYGIVSTPSSVDTVQPQDVTITNNTIDSVGNGDKYAVSDVIGSAPYRGTAVGLDTKSGSSEANPTADAGELTINQNNFRGVPVGVLNKDGSASLDAKNNWWGDVAGPGSSQVKQAPTSDFGPVRTSPHLDAPFDEGGQPVFGGAFVSPGPNLIDFSGDGSYDVDVVSTKEPPVEALNVHITSNGTSSSDFGTSAVRLSDPPTLGDVTGDTALTYDYYEGAANTNAAPDEVWLLLRETDGTTHVLYRTSNDNTSGESLKTRDVGAEVAGNPENNDGYNWFKITDGGRDNLGDGGATSDLSTVYSDDTEIVSIAAGRGTGSGAVSDVYYGSLTVGDKTLSFPGREQLLVAQ